MKRFFKYAIMAITILAFVACGQDPKVKSKSRNLLISKGASPISAPSDLVGEYESYNSGNALDRIKISSSGAVTITANGKTTNELLGKDSNGRYFISNTLLSSTYVLTYTSGYRIQLSSSMDNSDEVEDYYIIH